MSRLTASECAALEQFAHVVGEAGFVLVGAAALGFHVNMTWRRTADLDLVLALPMENLSETMAWLPGWSREERREHRWIAPGDIRLDILPVGGDALQRGSLTWPGSGGEMNLIGVRLALERAEMQQASSTLRLRVPPVEVILLLKIVAYLDRPMARTTDLGDIAHAMHEFLAPDADERFTIAAGTDYDDAGAFIVGRRLSAIVNEDEREAVARFLEKLRDEDDRHHSQARMLRESPRAWAAAPDDLLRRLVALEDGLGIPP